MNERAAASAPSAQQEEQEELEHNKTPDKTQKKFDARKFEAENLDEFDDNLQEEKRSK